MRVLIATIALVLAGEAQAQSQRGVTFVPLQPAQAGQVGLPAQAAQPQSQRGVLFIPEGGAVPTAAPRWAERLLKVTGAPQVVTSLAARNDVVVRVPVTHAVTGELTAPLERWGDWLSGITPLAVGTKMYATQLSNMQLWCAPRPSKRPAEWVASCFHPSILGRYKQASAVGDGLFVTRATIQTGGGAIAPPAIAVVPHDFGVPMRLVYKFGGWNRRYAELEAYVEHDGASSRLAGKSALREADGSARFELLGSELKLTPAGPKGRDAAVEVVRLATELPASPY